MHARRLNPVSLYLSAEMRRKVDVAAEALGLSRVEYIRRVLALHVDQDAAVAPLPWRVGEAERRIDAIEAAVGIACVPNPAGPDPLTPHTARPRARAPQTREAVGSANAAERPSMDAGAR